MVDDVGKERSSVDYPGNSRRYLGADSPCHSAKGYRRIASRTGLFRNTVCKYPSAPKAGGIAKDGPSSSDDQLSRKATIGQPGPGQAETPTRTPASPLGRPDLPVAHRRPAAGDPHPRVATGPWMPGVLPVAAGLHPETKLEQAQQDRGAAGGQPAGESGRARLRAVGPDP